MKIIAFETALRKCSVALGIDGEQVDYAEASALSQQSEELFSLVGQIFARHKITWHDIDAVAVNIGPGSFTGVRIGVAAAKGLKLALPKLLLIGVNSLEILAATASSSSLIREPRPAGDSGARLADDIIISLLEAGQQDFYCQIFDYNLTPLEQLQCLDAEQLKQLLAAYPQAKIVSHCDLTDAADYTKSGINADAVLSLAYQKSASIIIGDDVTPLYVKTPHITTAKPR